MPLSELENSRLNLYLETIAAVMDVMLMITCSLSPVKVDAIFQNRMWPVPEVVRMPGRCGEKRTVYTSWLKALLRSTMDSLAQNHKVNR
jgi:hypothetical protein